MQHHAPTVFSLVLKGPAFADHSMDVRDMAPILLGLVGALERANYLVYQDRSPVRLSVRRIRPSSFEIVLEVAQQVAETAGMVGDVGWLLLPLGWAIKQKLLRRRGRKKEAENTDRGRRAAEGKSGEMLAEDPIVRGHLETVVQVLSKDGVDSIVIKQQRKEIVSVGQEDVEDFATKDAEQSEILGPQLERALRRYGDTIDKSSLADSTKLEYKRQAGYFVRWLRGNYKPGIWK